MNDMRFIRSVAPLLALTALSPFVLASDMNGQSVRVTARGLNVRDADGNRKCVVTRNTQMTAIGRHADGDRIKVRLNIPGCPGEGWVYSNYVLPNARAVVDAGSLSLRSGPSASNRWMCGLPRNTNVEVVDDTDKPGWFKVSLPSAPNGCPTEGFVHGSYLKPEQAFFDGLPLASGSAVDRVENTEAGAGICETGDCTTPGGATSNLEDLRDVAAAGAGTQGQFLTELRKLIANPSYKSPHYPKGRDGMIQFPFSGRQGKAGPCGSARYNPDELLYRGQPRGVDTYIQPATACAFTAALQEWKKNFCPDSTQGCRLAWGDISHKTKAQWDGHKTHNKGHCIDIRPARKGAFADAGFTYRNRSVYSAERTKKMIEVLKQFGGTGVRNGESPYFNDTSCGTSARGGHDNHIHVCFNPDNPKVTQACNELVIDPNVCEELQ